MRTAVLPLVVIVVTAGFPFGGAWAAAPAAGDEPPERARLHVRTPDHGVLGIRVESAAGSRGVRVAAVSPGGPAAAAGVLPGDVIVALDGRPMKSGHDVAHAMRDIGPGGRVALDLHRRGRPLSVFVDAGVLSPDALYFDETLDAPGDLGRLPGMLSLPRMAACLGEGLGVDDDAADTLRLATLTAKLGRYFGAGEGVLVLHAPPDSPLRLEDGDVLTAIDGRVPQSAAHAWRILQSYGPGEKLTLQVLRQRKPLRLDVTMPADEGGPVRYRRAPAPAPGQPAVPPPPGP